MPANVPSPIHGRLSDVARSYLSATASIATGTLLARVVGLVTTLAAASVLGISAYGRFSFLLASSGVIWAIGLLGIGPIATRAIAAETAKNRSIGSAALVLGAAVLAVAGCAYVATCATPSGGRLLGNTSIDSALVVAAWSVPAGLNPLLGDLLAGHRAFRLVASLSLARAVIVGLSTVLAAWIGRSATTTASGALVGEAVTLALGVAIAGSRDYLSLRPDVSWRRHMRNLARAAIGVGAASVLITAAVWFGQRLLISHPDGNAENGAFALAQRLLLIVTLVPNALATVALPRLTRLRHEARSPAARRVVALATALALSGSVLLAAAMVVGSILVPGRFSNYTTLLIIMSFAGTAVSLNNICGSVAVAFAAIRVWIVSDIALAVVLAAAAPPLVSVLGGTGLAIAYLTAYVCSVGVLLPPLRTPRKETAS